MLLGGSTAHDLTSRKESSGRVCFAASPTATAARTIRTRSVRLKRLCMMSPAEVFLCQCHGAGVFWLHPLISFWCLALKSACRMSLRSVRVSVYGRPDQSRVLPTKSHKLRAQCPCFCLPPLRRRSATWISKNARRRPLLLLPASAFPILQQRSGDVVDTEPPHPPVATFLSLLLPAPPATLASAPAVSVGGTKSSKRSADIADGTWWSSRMRLCATSA